MMKICKNCKCNLNGVTSTRYCNECNALRTVKMVAKHIQRIPCRTNFVKYRVNIRRNGTLCNVGTFDNLKLAVEARDSFTKTSKPIFGGSSQKTNNISYFHTRRGELLLELRYCNRCNKDLKLVTRYEWCVHHIDHNRDNNIDSNFELLCKRCHQAEHRNIGSDGRFIQSSTTIPKGSTPKQVEAVGVPYL